MENVESQSQMIGKRVSYSNRSNNRFVGVIRDRVKVALASGTNEYQSIDDYEIEQFELIKTKTFSLDGQEIK